MRAFDWVPAPRWPASAFLWSLLVAGHAAAAWAPLPAVLLVPALATAGAAGAVSLALAVLASRRPPGIRRSGLAAFECATGVLAAVVGHESPALRAQEVVVRVAAVRVRARLNRAPGEQGREVVSREGRAGARGSDTRQR